FVVIVITFALSQLLPSLHDALPTSPVRQRLSRTARDRAWRTDTARSGGCSTRASHPLGGSSARPSRNRLRTCRAVWVRTALPRPDRKSTRLNSSHVKNSYAVLC